VTDDDFDENRELCSDGNCLGILVDGTCSVCGRGGASESDTFGRPLAAGGSEEPDAFDEDRQLCFDGACTGLLNSDGKCRVCGRTSGPHAS
jgi:hypothetical protein